MMFRLLREDGLQQWRLKRYGPLWVVWVLFCSIQVGRSSMQEWCLRWRAVLSMLTATRIQIMVSTVAAASF